MLGLYHVLVSAGELSHYIQHLLETAPCPVSEVLIRHQVEHDDNVESAATLVAIRAALAELVNAQTAVHVPHNQVEKRWPPAAFQGQKSSDFDDQFLRALGAWAAARNVPAFDSAVRNAHLPKHRHEVRPYVDLGWWGRLEPSPEFIADAEGHMKGAAGLYGM